MPLFVGLITGRVKKHQLNRLRAAAERHNEETSRYHQTRRDRVVSERAFVAERAASLVWLQPRLNKTASRLGLRRAMFGVGGALGGITEANMKSLLEKVRSALVMAPRSAFDRVVTVSFGAALLLEGIDQLDKLEMIDVPVLHDKIADVLSEVHVPGAELIGDGLAELGIDLVTDLLGDLFIVGGIAKGTFNLAKAAEFGEKADQVVSSVEAVEKRHQEESLRSKKVGALAQRLESCAYEAFKWSYVAETLQSSRGISNRALRDTIKDGFSRSMVALWQTHKASPEEMRVV